MRELVSVVIPTYNRAHSILPAIHSVLAQTYKHWELIVVDDGSTDNTVEVLANMGNVVRIIRQPNAGPSMARNTGIQAARGEYVAFLDSDDKWMPTKLERQVPLMCDSEVVFSGTNWQNKEQAAEQKGCADESTALKSWNCDSPAQFVSQSGGHPLLLSSWLVRRNALLLLGGFDTTCVPAEDNHMLFRLAFRGKFAVTEEVLLIRDSGLDDVKLTRTGSLKYDRKVTRSMNVAIATGRSLACAESRLVQRQFSTMHAHYLRREMEFAALDGDNWRVRRRAMETLTLYPDARDCIASWIGLVAPFLVRRRIRRKYHLDALQTRTAAEL